MKFFNEDFILKGPTARALYHEVAEKLPIIDYHCHLNPAEIAQDKHFRSITEVWLGGDHYKWRSMRIFGIDEKYITGDGSDFEKFYAYAQMLEYAIGNPLHHWTHLEMKRFFDIDEALTTDNAKELFDHMNSVLAKPETTARKFIVDSNVETICTTDDPADTLEHHIAIAANPVKNCSVRPTFRPDRALALDAPDYADYLVSLGKAAGMTIATADDLLAALKNRIDFFEKQGCKLSDHAFGKVPSVISTYEQAKATFEKRLNGGVLTAEELEGFQSYMLLQMAAVFNQKNWTMQLHFAAMRNNNEKMFKRLGRDTGFDTMSDYEAAHGLSRLLDAMNNADALPRTILYTLNPKDFYAMIALCGCFTQAGIKGKVQFGSAWWFIDHKDGMEKQLRETASLNPLGVFIGMLTDSRSFLSYPRHEYFRRIVCNLIGEWVDNGEFPADRKLLDRIVAGISHDNAKTYFDF